MTRVRRDPNDMCGDGVCPKCGSSNIIKSTSSDSTMILCHDCNSMTMNVGYRVKMGDPNDE